MKTYIQSSVVISQEGEQYATDGDSLWLLDETVLLVTLPLIRLVDDVTYLHVEPPVLRLQRAAGRSLCQQRGNQVKLQ